MSTDIHERCETAFLADENSNIPLRYEREQTSLLLDNYDFNIFIKDYIKHWQICKDKNGDEVKCRVCTIERKCTSINSISVLSETVDDYVDEYDFNVVWNPSKEDIYSSVIQSREYDTILEHAHEGMTTPTHICILAYSFFKKIEGYVSKEEYIETVDPVSILKHFVYQICAAGRCYNMIEIYRKGMLFCDYFIKKEYVCECEKKSECKKKKKQKDKEDDDYEEEEDIMEEEEKKKAISKDKKMKNIYKYIYKNYTMALCKDAPCIYANTGVITDGIVSRNLAIDGRFLINADYMETMHIDPTIFLSNDLFEYQPGIVMKAYDISGLLATKEEKKEYLTKIAEGTEKLGIFPSIISTDTKNDDSISCYTYSNNYGVPYEDKKIITFLYNDTDKREALINAMMTGSAKRCLEEKDKQHNKYTKIDENTRNAETIAAIQRDCKKKCFIKDSRPKSHMDVMNMYMKDRSISQKLDPGFRSMMLSRKRQFEESYDDEDDISCFTARTIYPDTPIKNDEIFTVEDLKKIQHNVIYKNIVKQAETIIKIRLEALRGKDGYVGDSVMSQCCRLTPSEIFCDLSTIEGIRIALEDLKKYIQNKSMRFKNATSNIIDIAGETEKIMNKDDLSWQGARQIQTKQYSQFTNDAKKIYPTIQSTGNLTSAKRLKIDTIITKSDTEYMKLPEGKKRLITHYKNCHTGTKCEPIFNRQISSMLHESAGYDITNRHWIELEREGILEPHMFSDNEKKKEYMEKCRQIASLVDCIHKEHGCVFTADIGSRSSSVINSRDITTNFTAWIAKYPYMRIILNKIPSVLLINPLTDMPYITLPTESNRKNLLEDQLMKHLFPQKNTYCMLNRRLAQRDGDIYRTQHIQCPLMVVLEAARVYEKVDKTHVYGGQCTVSMRKKLGNIHNLYLQT